MPRTNKSCENYRVITVSGTNALNFYYISQLIWKSDQKGGIVKKKQQVQNRVTCAKLISPNQDLLPNLIKVSAFPKNVLSIDQLEMFWSEPVR